MLQLYVKWYGAHDHYAAQSRYSNENIHKISNRRVIVSVIMQNSTKNTTFVLIHTFWWLQSILQPYLFTFDVDTLASFSVDKNF